MAKDYDRSDFEAFYDSAIEDFIEAEIRDELLKAKKHVIDLAMVEMEVFLAGFKQLCYINPINFSFEIVNCIYPNAEDIQRQVAESLAALVLQSFYPIFEDEIYEVYPQVSTKKAKFTF